MPLAALRKANFDGVKAWRSAIVAWICEIMTTLIIHDIHILLHDNHISFVRHPHQLSVLGTPRNSIRLL
jgi:hypothetical protein